MPSVRRFAKWQTRVAWPMLVLAMTTALPASGEEDRFSEYEIRVIRPRYFQKSDRIELGAQIDTVMNQAFIYSFLATGILSYHISEALSLEARAGYGLSLDKADKRILSDNFNIKTVVLRTETATNARLQWVPAYGKFQLESGKIVYFDTGISAGAGLTGVRYTYDHCPSPESVDPEVADRISPPPSPSLKQYPTITAGLAQRYFYSKDTAIRVAADLQVFSYPLSDGSCDPAFPVEGETRHTNILLGLGLSHFF